MQTCRVLFSPAEMATFHSFPWLSAGCKSDWVLCQGLGGEWSLPWSRATVSTWPASSHVAWLAWHLRHDNDHQTEHVPHEYSHESTWSLALVALVSITSRLQAMLTSDSQTITKNLRMQNDASNNWPLSGMFHLWCLLSCIELPWLASRSVFLMAGPEL